MLVTFRRLVSGSLIGELRITTGVVETTKHKSKTVSREVAANIRSWRKTLNSHTLRLLYLLRIAGMEAEHMVLSRL
jgi:hypothetical protein